MFIRTERSVKEFMSFYPVVSVIIIIHLALWVLTEFFSWPLGNAIRSLGIGSNYFISQGEYWRLFTSIFLHAGLMHTLFNSFSLVLFGPALEQMLGKTKFILAYIGAGLAGNLATYFLAPGLYAYVGASGAIFGLFGMYVFMVGFRKHLIDQDSSQIIMIIFIIGLIMTFIRPGINIYAHVFGFIGGFALAPIVLNNAQPFSPWRNQRRHVDDGSIQFNPSRWKKRRLPPGLFSKGLWILLGILVVLGLVSRLF